jgi:hypothetical protein
LANRLLLRILFNKLNNISPFGIHRIGGMTWVEVDPPLGVVDAEKPISLLF